MKVQNQLQKFQIPTAIYILQEVQATMKARAIRNQEKYKVGLRMTLSTRNPTLPNNHHVWHKSQLNLSQKHQQNRSSFLIIATSLINNKRLQIQNLRRKWI